MEPMAWDMERRLSHDNMTMKLQAWPLQEAKYQVVLHIVWFSEGGSSTSATPQGTTVVDRSYDQGLTAFPEDLVLRCRLTCDMFDVYPHVRSLRISQLWGEEIFAFSRDAVRAARDSGCRGVGLLFSMQVLQNPQATVPAKPKRQHAFNKLKRGKYRGGGDDEELCTICLDKLEGEIEVAWMPCAHAFHDPCLVQWLKRSRICPLCRMKL